MKRLTINPSSKLYYSEDFIKGFEYGTQRQLEADLADRPQDRADGKRGRVMTNEEAKEFLDNLKICINEHPIVADWLVDLTDRTTEKS